MPPDTLTLGTQRAARKLFAAYLMSINLEA